jgi:GT2 family glycosyltransferase
VNPVLVDVSVIVVAYNARAFISQCLDALLGQDYERYEVIVVDNASSDGTAEFVQRAYPALTVVESSTNRGFGAGNNLGAAKAAGEVFAFLNPDAVPAVDWLRQLVGTMRRCNRQLATSMILLQSDPTRLNSGGNLVHYLGLSYCRGLHAPRQAFATTELVSGASGAAMAITRQLFDRVGGFDETFFLYHDDVDLSVRSMLLGERCLYVPTAVVAHDYDLSVPSIKWRWVEAHRYAVLLKALQVRTLLVLLPALMALDLVTFAYLATRGRSFVRSKLASYAWVVKHLSTILAARRQLQERRVLTDFQVLNALTDQIPFEQLASGAPALLAHSLLDPWFEAYRRFSLAVVRW